ncbi:NAD-dependent epimerase/dehydratase family protein [Rubellimicrobium arenae]|uniref:NAD-dependent epimerase/dehydratase family protein n=1 Tax=Rubellimicrobium arenae TaxID=2817372 RepID=UPI001B3157BF
MTTLVTGAAGFIGFHVARRLLDRGERVIGLDSLNSYYAPQLKRDRLAELAHPAFTFHEVNLADAAALRAALAGERPRRIIHLAAQAGVRHSMDNPQAYVESNLVGQVNLLEYARHLGGLESLVYASSSSVYGGNTRLPFSESDPVDNPVSLYAATKKSDELMGNVYAHLFRIPMTGLRFFTVYGPWGRPDMALWVFTEAILEGRPLPVFNHGDMSRDFTYVDDVVAGVLAAADTPPRDDGQAPPHRIYNIGNNRPEPLMRLIDTLEQAIGRTAQRELLPMQPGDVASTYADITAIRRDLGWEPTTPIEVGVPRFVDWFRRYHGLA